MVVSDARSRTESSPCAAPEASPMPPPSTSSSLLGDRKLYHRFEQLYSLEEQLAERAEAFHDKTVPATAVSMDAASGELVVKNGVSTGYPLQEQATELLAERLRIPHPYLLRCPPELRAENVNHWLRGLKDKPLLLRFDGSEVRAVLTARYRPLDNLDLVRMLQTAAETKNLGCTVRCEWSPTRFVAHVAVPQLERRVVAESYLGGLMIGNSEVGLGRVRLDALLLRLICTNGMIVKDTQGLSRVHRADPEDVKGAVASTITGIFRQLPTIADAVAVAADESMTLTVDNIAKLLRDMRITGDPTAILDVPTLTRGPIRRMDLVNAVTAAANRPAIDLADREALQALGGRLLTERRGAMLVG